MQLSEAIGIILGATLAFIVYLLTRSLIADVIVGLLGGFFFTVILEK